MSIPRTLRMPMRGPEVTFLHALLNYHLPPPDDQLPLTGPGAADFAPRTEAKVKKFQQINKIDFGTKDFMYGVVGPHTWPELTKTQQITVTIVPENRRADWSDRLNGIFIWDHNSHRRLSHPSHRPLSFLQTILRPRGWCLTAFSFRRAVRAHYLSLCTGENGRARYRCRLLRSFYTGNTRRCFTMSFNLARRTLRIVAPVPIAGEISIFSLF